MTRNEQPEHVLAENELADFADSWVGGDLPTSTNDLEATFARVQRVMGESQPHPSIHVDSVKKEPIMHQHPIATLESPSALRESSASSWLAAGVRRWQPAVSLVVMLALLGGLVAIAWDRQMRDPEPAPSMLAALQDDATPATEGCAPPPPSVADAELLDAALSDWPAPLYFATGYADAETAAAVRATFISYIRCADEAGFYSADGETFRPEIREYFSPRTRYITLYQDLTSDQRAAIDVFSCRPREADVLREFPFLVNGQLLPVAMDAASFYDNLDVYVLDDGRYAMGMARIRTETLRNPTESSGRDEFGVVTLVEQNGHFYIDEYFIAFSSDLSRYSYGQMTGDCD